MLRTLLATTALLSVVSGQAIVNSPAALIQCLIPGGQPSAAALETFPTQDAPGSYTWIVNIAAGNEVTIRITDAAGLINYSSPLVIQPGTSDACLGQSNPVGGASTAGTTAARTSSTAATTSAITTTAATTSAITTTAATTSAGTTTSVPSTASTAPSLVATTTTRATTTSVPSTASTATARPTTTTATGGAIPLERTLFALGIGALLALAA